MNQALKKIIAVSVICGVLLGQIVSTPVSMAGSFNDSPMGGNSSSGDSGAVAQSAAQCMVSTLIASILTSAIMSVIGSTVAQYFTGTGTKVPIENQNNDLREHGMTVGGTSVPLLPSMNAIAYCLINVIITYIADSTINWIRSGFEGNPVFVDDPEQFFQNLADYELGRMLQQITGANLCEPFSLQVKLNLLRQATRTYSNTAVCTLGQAYNNLQNGFNSSDWLTLTQNPYNNPYGSYFEIANNLDANISRRQNTFQIELGWSKGFLSFPDPEDPTGRKRLSPGALIESQLAKRLGAAEDRLVLAEKFDQVINELVNQLVRIALNEVFEGSEMGTPNTEAYVNYFGGQDGSGAVPTRPIFEQIQIPAANSGSTGNTGNTGSSGNTGNTNGAENVPDTTNNNGGNDNNSNTEEDQNNGSGGEPDLPQQGDNGQNEPSGALFP